MTCEALCLAISLWLTQHGYDAPRRDAVLEYVRLESGFDPKVVRRTGACLFQWAGKRRIAVLALGRGRCPNWQTQVAHADRELRTVHRYGSFWTCAPGQAFREFRQHFGRGR